LVKFGWIVVAESADSGMRTGCANAAPFSATYVHHAGACADLRTSALAENGFSRTFRAKIVTLAEKFVALTRRVGESAAKGNSESDKTLVRHIYDLHVTRKSYDAAELVQLAAMIAYADAEEYGDKHPAYRNDPIGETLNGAADLASSSSYARQYAEFIRDMVYGQQAGFDAALKTIDGLCRQLQLLDPTP
jgi:hypothetical protein